jgi:hypothetical protein
MTNEELWTCKLAARKQIVSDAYDLAVDICDLEGGPAMIQGTPERMRVLQYVWRLPKFDHPRQERIMKARTTDEIATILWL